MNPIKQTAGAPITLNRRLFYPKGYLCGQTDREKGFPHRDMRRTRPDYIDGYNDGFEGKKRQI